MFCPFGHRFGTMVCMRLTDFFRYIMTQHNDVIFNYVDDLIGCGFPGAIYDAFTSKCLNKCYPVRM